MESISGIQMIWGGTPSCWKSKRLGKSSFRFGHNRSSVMSVRVVSAKKKGPYALSLQSALNTFIFGESRTDSALAWGSRCLRCAHSVCLLFFIARDEVRSTCLVQLSDEVLTEGRTCHFILFWKCLQHLQLVRSTRSRLSILWYGIRVECWLARRVDLYVLVNGRLQLLPLSRKSTYERVIDFLSGGSSPHVVRNRRWTVVTDFDL
jgi:hypothetical protein